MATSTALQATERTSAKSLPQRSLKRIRAIPLGLRIVLVVALLQVIGWSLAVAPLQGPDEPAHFAAIQYFAETGKLVRPSGGHATYSTEFGTVMRVLNLGDFLNPTAHPAWTKADLKLLQRATKHLPPGSRANGEGPNYIGTNPPLYYVLMAGPYKLFSFLPLPSLILVLRLVTGLFLLATVGLTWKIAGEVFPDRFRQTLAAAVVAVQPKLAEIATTIDPDGLLFTLCTAFLLISVRIVTRGPTARRVALAALLAAAASLTQGRGLITIPALLLALAIAWVRTRPALKEMLKRGVLAATILGAAALLYVAFGRPPGSTIYGGDVHNLNSGAFNIKQFLSVVFQFYFGRLPPLHPLGVPYGYRQVFIETFFGDFASFTVNFSQHVYLALQIMAGVGLLALYTCCVIDRYKLLKRWPVVAVMAGYAVILVGFLNYVSYRSLITSGGTEPLITGRYLFSAIALFGLAIAYVIGHLPRRARPVAAAGLLALGVCLSLVGMGTAVESFYV